MRHSRMLRLSAILALGATAAAMLAAAAAAAPFLKERFHEEGTFVNEVFCGVPGLTVDGTFVVDGSVLGVPHGPDGLAYFLEHITATSVLTNRANGETVTVSSRAINHDLRVTDNGDGTLTILFSATGNDVIYGADGKAIGRNPGQIRLEFIVDHGGTPTDPSDDVLLAQEIVKESTGRSDDFCETVVPALT
jgi:hypothetical protein